MRTPQFKLKSAYGFKALILITLCAPLALFAQTKTVDLGTVGASTAAGAFRPGEASKGTASAVAPVQASLEATQPQSLITRDFISLSVSPIAEYTRIVNIAPSVSGDASNGPGLSETKSTLRGFSDDQYNITFDGIPWGDTNNPAHHSTSFFPASVVGGASVERGPGNASNLGYATFGGSINMFSKQPAAEAHTNLFSSFGTWNTHLLGAGYESGRLASMGDATVQLNYQDLRSDGYLSNSAVKSRNAAVKIERPFGDNTLVTMFTTYNHINYAQPDSNKGATRDQIAAFGKNFQLDNDPKSMNFVDYNHTTKVTDFSYLRVRSDLGNGWKTDDYVYSYAYDNQTISSTDPKWTGTTMTLAAYPDPRFTSDANRVKVAGHIPGIDKQNQYRVNGAIVNLSKGFDDMGIARTGLWYEHSNTDRHQYDLDLTNNTFSRSESKVNAAVLEGTTRPIDSVKFDQQSNIRSLQPFLEFAWTPTTTTTITPGIKHVNITRAVDAQVEQTSRELGHHKSLDYSATLPYLTLNQRLNEGLAVYAQYAKGFQIPDLNTFYIAKPENNSTAPQQSINYQVGIVSKSDRVIWDMDIYRIEFKNKYVSNGLTGDAAAFVNIGGATYQGFEGQMAYVIGNGFSASFNGSINGATANDTGKQISGAPDKTVAIGGLYAQNGLSASLTYKLTGATHQKDFVCVASTSTCNTAYYEYYETPAYHSVDLGVSYTFAANATIKAPIQVKFNAFNLTNNDSVTAISTGSSSVIDDKRDTFIFHTPRSVMLSISVDF